VSLSSSVIERIIFRLEKVDDDIEAAKAAVDAEDEAAAIGCISDAAERKHRVINLYPGSFRDVYDIFYFLDLAADTATSYPNGAISDDVTVDEVIENLEQSLEDLEYLDDGYWTDAIENILQDLIDWLTAMIEYFKKHKQTDPNADATLPRDRKMSFFHELDATGDLEISFYYLDTIDRNLFLARRRLEKDPPDFAGAARFLKAAENNKHLLIDDLRERAAKKKDEPPEPREEDLPKHPDHV
jgi:hypothetical protein